MPRSSFSALHGVNPNQKKKKTSQPFNHVIRILFLSGVHSDSLQTQKQLYLKP